MKKALIIYYSQAGQTATAVKVFTAGLSLSHSCETVPVQCQEAFAFPWKMTSFFRAFPRCHRGPFPQAEVTPSLPWKDYDLIVLAYQVWFLSPSLPVRGFLSSPSAAGLASRNVLTLVTCRNLWQSAALKVRDHLRCLEAVHVGQITICERSPLWASFVTTPRWMLTGKKDAFSIFPEAGISTQEFASLEEMGRRVGVSVQECSDTYGANLNRVSLELMDWIGSRFFRLWSKIIVQIAPRAGRLQDGVLVMFRLNLMLLIISVGPCTKIFESIVGNDFKWIARIRRYRSL